MTRSELMDRGAVDTGAGGPAVPRDGPGPGDWPALGFGALFAMSGAANLLLVSLHPGAYDHFADAAYWPFITHAWRSVVVPHVSYWLSLLAVFEIGVGGAIVTRRFRLAGVAGAAGFSLALLLFGWGFFLWSVPMLGLLGIFALRELRLRHGERT